MNLIKIAFLFTFISLLACNSADQGAVVLGEKDKAPNYYTEKHRPQFHFSPEANWMNDPNGMVVHEGEYHLFYQYYPDSTVWGPMHWGHAVSKDMVTWEHLPIALYPDELGYIFSGSAVVDHNNTSGFGKNGKSPLIAIFTHHNMEGEKAKTNTFQYQSIAYSNDNGRTWTKYAGNPVVPNPGIKDFRDPKVIWHEASQKWIMVFAAYDRVRIYNSPDLKSWTYQSEFGIPSDDRLWECPDLFPIKVEGSGKEKWVMITSIQKKAPNGGTATSYFVGDFDGKKFIGDYKQQYWADFGKDNYAMVTWSDVPAADGRRLAMGWMSNWQYAQIVPTEKWRSAMTIARELTLHNENGDLKLRSNPVHELKKIEGKSITIESQTINESLTLVEAKEQSLFKINIKAKRPPSGGISLKMSNDQGEFIKVGFDGIANYYYIDRTQSGKVNFNKDFPGVHLGDANYTAEFVEMSIYLDHASVELFADDGRCVMTDIFFANSPYQKIELIAEKGTVELIEAEIIDLKRIW